MVGVTKIQRGNAGYWLAAVAEGGDDYYTKPGEAPGEWIGNLAAELGLDGEVDPEGYAAILEGRDPLTGEALVERPDTRFRHRPDGSIKRVEPVLGYDVRFSAPKSVSLLYALGSERTKQRIVAVMNDAVRQGITHLEREACMVQRGKGGKIIERGSGFVGMAFRHRMSRAGDPALHVHVVVSNLTRAAKDHKWLSLASPKGRSPLFPHGKSAGVVFQAALRAGFLREFGLEFGDVRHGYADLKGFSRELIETFSTRSREIAAWLKERGVSSPKAAQVAAYQTREAKDFGVDADQRIAEWEAQAAPLGFSRHTTEEMIAEATPREPRAIGEQAISRAVEKLEQTASHFSRRELLWAVAEQLPQGADHLSLRKAVDRALESEMVVRVYESTDLLDPDAYTTPLVAETEKSFIDNALQGTDAGLGVVDRATLDGALARHDYLGEDQRAMVERLLTGGEQVVIVAAWPGTGKTTALRATAEAWSEAGYSVFGAATARTATGELIDAGVDNSFSIASLRFQIEHRGKKLPEGSIVIIDEANVTSTFDLEALRSYIAGVGGKLVLIGDSKQIGSIGPGGLFTHAARVLGAASLTTIRRQRHEVDRRIVTLVHEGRGSDALDLLRSEGKLLVGEDLPSTLHGMLLDWYRDFDSGADAVMIARRNSDVEHLNQLAHHVRREEGKLGRLQIAVGGQSIAVGDRVLTRINSRQVSNRERWDVISVNPLARSVKLRRVGGDERTVKLKRAYLNRHAADGAPALQHAYAITKFGSESKTFDRAYALLDSGSSQNEELVALSRGREIATVYTVASSELLDPELGPARRELADTLQDLRDAIERDGADAPSLEFALRRQIEALTPWELAERRARLAAEARTDDPLLGHRIRLERAITRERDWVQTLGAEREASERLGDPPADIARFAAAQADHAERWRGHEAELEALPDPTSSQPAPAEPAERLEFALIEQKMSQLIRSEVTAGRLGDSPVIYKTLGAYPEDPPLASAWSEGAHSLVSYRLRNNITDPHNPLGPEPRLGDASIERARAQSRIDDAQRRLGRTHERQVERALDHSHGIEL